MTQVNVFEARNNLSRLVHEAAAGEEVIIANRGVPLVRLVPVAQDDRRHGSGRSIVEWLDAHPAPARLARSAAEIDADIEAERDAWQ